VHEVGPALPALVYVAEDGRFVQAPHTTFAALLQLDTLYWPVWHTEQVWHAELVVMPIPVEYVPDTQVVQETDELTPVPLE
jgi:hypothetical protein